MVIDTFEQQALTKPKLDVFDKMRFLNKGLDTKLTVVDGVYSSVRPETIDSIARWANTDATALTSTSITGTFDIVKQMYRGVETNGITTLGLEEISNWKVNPEYAYQNLKQHAGYAAEVISTAKENLQAKIDNTGITTYRADDRPDLYKRNDQYVDKIRVDQNGNILETIQTKFVGKNARECLSKLASKDYDKYFSELGADKMEVPSDYFDEMMRLADEKISSLENQLERVKADGKTDVAQAKEAQLERYKQIKNKLEKSNTSSEEAMAAIKSSEAAKEYTKKIFSESTMDTVKASNELGIKSGLTAAALTAAVSTVDNVQQYMAGEITAQEAFLDVAKDTGTAGALGYGTTFISNAVATTMTNSSQQLIQSLGKSGVPAAVIAMGVSSYDAISSYAQGEITGSELTYDLGENAASVAGGIIGSALAGAAVGSVAPGAGTVVGFGAGLVGGMVGTAIAAEAYSTAVELGGEGAEILASKAQEVATKTVEMAKVDMPDKVADVKSAINNFASANKIPIHI